MFWFITAVVVVALAALVWWSSGRAKPLRGRAARGPGLDVGVETARLDIHRRGDGTLGKM